MIQVDILYTIVISIYMMDQSHIVIISLLYEKHATHRGNIYIDTRDVSHTVIIHIVYKERVIRHDNYYTRIMTHATIIAWIDKSPMSFNLRVSGCVTLRQICFISYVMLH